MKVLITGATGFVGQHLCRSLTDQGHQVFALVRNIEKAKDLLPKECILQLDINQLNEESQKQRLLKELPRDLDAVIHTAGLVHSFQSRHFFLTNTESTKNLFEVIAKYQTSKPLKFIFLSSLAAAGPTLNTTPLNEEQTCLPVSDYGRSKLQAERYLQEKVRQHENIQLCILRPPMILGPGDQGVLEIIKMLKSGLVITTGKGGLEKSYSFISIFDLINLCERLIKEELSCSKTYFTAHPHKLSLRELTEAVKDKLNLKKVRKLQLPFFLLKPLAQTFSVIDQFSHLQLRLTPDKLNELVPSSWVCDGDKISRDLQYQYQDDFNAILDKTLQDYQKRGWI